MKSFNKYSTCLLLGIAASYTATSFADGGIALGATRLIYSMDSKQASMPVVNSTSQKTYLINAWVEDSNAKATSEIVLTPPMFVSEPKSESTLRLVNTNLDMKMDRETLYYLNVQAIPSVEKSKIEKNDVLQLAILSRIKMMIRPNGLKIPVENAPSLIEVAKADKKITFKNPTPYYMTLVKIVVEGQDQDSIMLDPYSSKSIKGSGNKISFQTINDYGAFTDSIVKTL